MKVTITAASLAVACGLAFGSLSAQGQSSPPAPIPSRPGEPAQPGQPTPGQPTPPAQPRPGQPTEPGQGATPATPRSGQAAETEITLTGCITRDTTKPAAGQAAAGFLLTNARVVSGTGAAAGAARSTASGQGQAGAARGAASGQGQAGVTNMGQEYRLMAKGDVNFTPHVNHQVRVTGMMMGRGMAPGQTGASNRPEGAAPNAGNVAMAPMFHVTELTMVAATCETK